MFLKAAKLHDRTHHFAFVICCYILFCKNGTLCCFMKETTYSSDKENFTIIL